jgi:DNA-binding transcriptional MocR family regulator
MGFMRIDWAGDGPLYVDVANLIHEEIDGGRFTPGMTLPSEKVFADAYGVGRDVIRAALEDLRRRGLITLQPGRDAQVRPATVHRPVTLRPGDEAIARMPSLAERRRLHLDEGVPVIEIRNRAGDREVHAATAVGGSRLRAFRADGPPAAEQLLTLGDLQAGPQKIKCLPARHPDRLGAAQVAPAAGARRHHHFRLPT